MENNNLLLIINLKLSNVIDTVECLERSTDTYIHYWSDTSEVDNLIALVSFFTAKYSAHQV